MRWKLVSMQSGTGEILGWMAAFTSCGGRWRQCTVMVATAMLTTNIKHCDDSVGFVALVIVVLLLYVKRDLISLTDSRCVHVE